MNDQRNYLENPVFAKDPDGNNRNPFVFLYFILGAIILGVLIWLLLPKQPDPLPAVTTNKITAPLSGSVQTSPITVQGGPVVKNLPEQAVWLLTEYNGYKWPKQELFEYTEGWEVQIVEGSSGDAEISIILALIDQAGQESIQQWLLRGQETNEYPGFPEIPGLEILDVVSIGVE